MIINQDLCKAETKEWEERRASRTTNPTAVFGLGQRFKSNGRRRTTDEPGCLKVPQQLHDGRQRRHWALKGSGSLKLHKLKNPHTFSTSMDHIAHTADGMIAGRSAYGNTRSRLGKKIVLMVPAQVECEKKAKKRMKTILHIGKKRNSPRPPCAHPS